MGFGVGELISLIGLIAGLASAGASAGSSGKSTREGEKAQMREEDIQRSEKREKKRIERESKRAALARAIGAKDIGLRKPGIEMPAKYTPEDTAALDTTAAALGAGGSALQQGAGLYEQSQAGVPSGPYAEDVGGIKNPQSEIEPGKWIESKPYSNEPLPTGEATGGGFAKRNKYDEYRRRYA